MGFPTLNKKGSILDMFLILSIIVVTAIVIVISLQIYSDYHDQVTAQSTDEINFTTTHHDFIHGRSVMALSRFDTIFLFFVIGLIIAVIVSSFSIPTHPVFFIIAVLTLSIVLMLSAILSNVYEEAIVNTSAFNTTAVTYFPKTLYLMGQLPVIMLIGGALALIAIFAKGRQEQY